LARGNWKDGRPARAEKFAGRPVRRPSAPDRTVKQADGDIHRKDASRIEHFQKVLETRREPRHGLAGIAGRQGDGSPAAPAPVHASGQAWHARNLRALLLLDGKQFLN
jgi:hypothetical protein